MARYPRRIANKKRLAPRIASASSQSEISASGIATAAVFLLLSGAFVENKRVDSSSVDSIVYSWFGHFNSVLSISYSSLIDNEVFCHWKWYVNFFVLTCS